MRGKAQREPARPRILKSVAIATSLEQPQNGNVTSAGWQVTLCDPMWHVSFRSGVAKLHYFTLLYFTLNVRLIIRILTFINPENMVNIGRPNR